MRKVTLGLLFLIIAGCGGSNTPLTPVTPPVVTPPVQPTPPVVTPTPVPVVKQPTLTFSISPKTIVSGSSATLTWSTTNATSCSASNGWSGSSEVINGTLKVSPTTNTTYTLTCKGATGSTPIVSSVSIIVTKPTPPVVVTPPPVTPTPPPVVTPPTPVKPTPPPVTPPVVTPPPVTPTPPVTPPVVTPPAEPTLTFTAAPITLVLGNTATLTWSTTNATACTGTNGWSGNQQTSGSLVVTPTTNTTYTLTCTGATGTTPVTDNVSVSVTTPPPPVVNNATLTWTAPTLNTDGTATTLSGYIIYYGQNANNLTTSLPVSGGTTTTAQITNLASGTWYFTCVAVRTDGVVSAHSAVASVTY